MAIQTLPPALQLRLGTRDAAADHDELNKAEVLVMSWTGTRGVISLAAIFALPLATDSGRPFAACTDPRMAGCQGEHPRERVAALEQKVHEQSTMRAAQDSDLSTVTSGLRAANNLLQALALTQSDQTAVLAEHTRTLADHTRRLSELDAGVKTIIEMLGTLISRDDRESDSPSG